MVVLSKKGTTWYKTFDTVSEVAVLFEKNQKLKKENYILIEFPSYKEINLDEL